MKLLEMWNKFMYVELWCGISNSADGRIIYFILYIMIEPDSKIVNEKYLITQDVEM